MSVHKAHFLRNLSGCSAIDKREWSEISHAGDANRANSGAVERGVVGGRTAARATTAEGDMQRTTASLFESIAREQTQVVGNYGRPHVGLEVR